MTDVEQKSVELKQNLNNLADMVNDSDNTAVAQDLKTTMKRWEDTRRFLAAEREHTNKRWE